jgi:SAM-dependent methyltransferase
VITLQRNCPVCGYSKGEILHHQEYLVPDELQSPPDVDIVSCLRCGLGFADLRTQQDVLDDEYRDHSKYADTSLYADDPAQQNRPPTDAPWDLERLAGTAAWLAGHLPPNARVLDSGCATGALLGFLKDVGFTNLVGLDPSPTATATATRLYGVPTVTGSFLDPPADIGAFDLVVLSHVLEHLADVEGAVQGMWTLTGPGGLVYIEVPDAARYAEFLVAPFHDFNTEHINHFSAATLELAMARAGFETIHIGTKDVLCSPTDPYPALFGLFRHGANQVQSLVIERDVQLVASLRSYVHQSSQLMASMDSHILAAAAENSLVVWGAGQLAMKLLSGVLSGCTVSAIVDTSASKWGQHFGDMQVVGPTHVPDDSSPILITSIHHQASIRSSIAEQFPGRQVIELR